LEISIFMSPRVLSQKPPKPFERVMIFIDGGYLRELCKDFFGHDNIDFKKLRLGLIQRFNNLSNYPFQANLIRIYYYDAIVDKEHSDYETQRKYFGLIDKELFYTVRLGDLVQSSKKRFKQKGVDILMAIDALAKAYENQYDLGIFIAGDRDFVPLVKAVKDAGKKTLCLAHIRNSWSELLSTFDMRLPLNEKTMKSWLK
jgi:uncharacterized LabA/DUF88 family protein